MVHPAPFAIGKTKQESKWQKVIAQILQNFSPKQPPFSPKIWKYLTASLQQQFYFITFSDPNFLCYLCMYIKTEDTLTEIAAVEVSGKASKEQIAFISS